MPFPGTTPEEGQSPPMADASSDISSLVSQGKLPEDPAIISAIKEGKISADVASQRYLEYLSKTNPEKPINPAPETEASAHSNYSGNGDQILQKMVSEDRLPNMPDVLGAIKSGTLNLETAMKRYQEFKAKTGPMSISSDGTINKVEDQKAALQAPKNPLKDPNSEDPTDTFVERFKAGLAKQVQSDVYILKKLGQGLSFGLYNPEIDAPDTATAISGGIALLAGGIASGLLTGGLVRMVPVLGGAIKGLEAGAKASVGLAKHAKAIGALTLEAAPLGFATGVARSEIESGGKADISDALADGIIEAAEFTAGGAALYGVVGGAAKAFGALKGSRQKGLNSLVQRTPEALDIVQSPSRIKATIDYLEAVKNGDVVGEGSYRTEPWQMTREDFGKNHFFHGSSGVRAGGKDAASVSRSGKVNKGYMIDAGAKGASGFASKYAADGGSLFVVRRLEGVEYDPSEAFARNNIYGASGEKIIAEIPGGTDDVHKFLVKKALSEGKVIPKNVISEYPDLKNNNFLNGSKNLKASWSTEQDRVLGALKKIYASQPQAGPALDILADPKATHEVLRNSAKSTVEALLTGSEAPLRPLYEGNKTLQSMVSNGKYVDAVDSLQGIFRENLKDYGTGGELMAAPFLDNQDTLYNVVAARAERRIDTSLYPRYSRRLLIDYMKTPTREAENALRAAVPKKTAFTAITREAGDKFFDVRLSYQDADQLASDILKGHMDTFQNKGALPFGAIGKLKDTDAIVKAAVTFNREMNRDMMKAYRSGLGSHEDNFVHVGTEMQEALRSEINVRRAMIEKNDAIMENRELASRMGELKVKLRSETGAYKKDFKKGLGNIEDLESLKRVHQIKEELRELRTKRKAAVGRIAALNSSINESLINVNSLEPALQSQVRGTADRIFIPTRKQLGKLNELTGEIEKESTTNFLDRFGLQGGIGKTNPFALKDEGGLADTMSMLLASGRDIQGKTSFGSGFFNNLVRDSQKEFGYGNSIETLVSWVKEREVMKKTAGDFYRNQVRQLGLKKGEKLSDIAQRYAEKKLLPTDPEFLSLSAAEQNKVTKAATTFRGMYDELIDAHNQMAERLNIPQIAKREDYITHIVEVQDDLPKILDQWLNGEKPLKPGNAGPYNIQMATHKADPSKTFFRFEKPRSGNEYVSDIVNSFDTYLDPMLDRIFNTEIVLELKSARAFAPQKMGELLDHIKDSYLLKIPNEIESGTYGKGTSKFGKKVLQYSQRKQAEGQLMFKASVAVQQLGSAALDFAVGGRDALVATAKMFTKEGQRAWGMSQNRVLRSAVENVDLDSRLFTGLLEKLNKVPGSSSVKAGYDYWKKAGLFALSQFDEIASRHTFLTAFEQAKRYGMKEGDAARYADKWTDLLQVSFARIDKPDNLLQRTTIGRALMQFQSFSNNLFATLMNDLPNMAYHGGTTNAVKSLLRAGAAISILNETYKNMGMPEPMSARSFLPLVGTIRYGFPGITGASVAFAKNAFSGDFEKAFKDLGTWFATNSVAGGGQIRNVVSAFEAKKKREIRGSGEFAKAALFGAKTVKRDKEEARNERKTFGYKYQKAARSFVKKNLFRQ